jgi:hypothetical protein
LVLLPPLSFLGAIIAKVKGLNCHTNLLTVVLSIADDALRRPPDLARDYL